MTASSRFVIKPIYASYHKLARQKDYPHIAAAGRRSVLPPELQAAVVGLTEAIDRGRDVEDHLSSVLDGLTALSAAAIVRAAAEIRNLGGLHARYDSAEWFPSFLRRDPYPTRAAELRALARHPSLARLYIIHGDGRIRQAALKSLSAPPDDPFAFTAIAYRLNDWVEPVRRSARKCAARLFPRTSAAVVAQASLALFLQIERFGRWNDEEREALETTLQRPDVMEALADLLCQRPPGPVGSIFRQALKKPGLDDSLPRLAREAVLPLVRAIALETLVMRRARWLRGYGQEWVDKRFGLRRRVPLFDERPVAHGLHVEDLLALGAEDPAVVVRKVVTRGLIDLRHDLSLAMEAVARRLAHDRSQSVRTKAQFYLEAQAKT